jgi:hypothetical protein
MEKTTIKLGGITENEFQEAILREKTKGTSDLEIGQKYGVTFRYIERLTTKSQGINISARAISEKDPLGQRLQRRATCYMESQVAGTHHQATA